MWNVVDKQVEGNDVHFQKNCPSNASGVMGHTQMKEPSIEAAGTGVDALMVDQAFLQKSWLKNVRLEVSLMTADRHVVDLRVPVDRSLDSNCIYRIPGFPEDRGLLGWNFETPLS